MAQTPIIYYPSTLDGTISILNGTVPGTKIVTDAYASLNIVTTLAVQELDGQSPDVLSFEYQGGVCTNVFLNSGAANTFKVAPGPGGETSVTFDDGTIALTTKAPVSVVPFPPDAVGDTGPGQGQGGTSHH